MPLRGVGELFSFPRYTHEYSINFYALLVSCIFSTTTKSVADCLFALITHTMLIYALKSNHTQEKRIVTLPTQFRHREFDFYLLRSFVFLFLLIINDFSLYSFRRTHNHFRYRFWLKHINNFYLIYLISAVSCLVGRRPQKKPSTLAQSRANSMKSLEIFISYVP